ncbi:MAG TPA: prepilin-type N-terminal cleavage/methylation domain-containing protein [Polyangiales bacterium]
MRTNHRRRRSRRRGFTLIEIMIVVVIMGMMAAAVGFSVVGMKRDADLRLARNGLRALANIADAFQLTQGSASECPTLAQLEGSKLLRAGASLEDPWGMPYELSCETGEVDVRSSGPDRQRGSPDDLTLRSAPAGAD